MTNNREIKPVFIFSLPGSGSTLLQRILISHPKVPSSSEPWMLLPFFYSIWEEGNFAEYAQSGASRAITDFIAGMPNGKIALAKRIDERSKELVYSTKYRVPFVQV